MFLAHVVGHRDGPIPLSYALVAGGAALYASFEAMRLRRHRSRFDQDSPGRPVPAALARVADSAVTRWLLRSLGLVLVGGTAAVAVLDRPGAGNLALSLVYVVFWVGLVPASIIFGPVWRALNPLRTVQAVLARLLRRAPEQGFATLPRWLGYWPAAAGLLAFAWLELVSPDRLTAGALVTWFSAYGLIHLVAGMVFGSEWFAHADAFEVYSALLARLSPWARRADGRVVLRNPFINLAALRPSKSLVAVVAVLLAATAYDSLSNGSWWKSLEPTAWTGTLGLLGVLAVVALTFTGSAALSGVLAGRPAVAGRLAHSVLPIAVGYVLAHYLSVFISELQLVYHFAAGHGQHATHLAGAGTSVPPALMSVIQVGAVLTGHVLGVVAAHDRAVRLFPGHVAVRAQLPVFACMLAYTAGGLVLLYNS
ncbi:hypothetical protein YIM_27010 [Amycolatopsis sp. YIM 10]|nr:hypothetical protein YIM_27010 [Amycolatopsis sp. YIM 10]